MIIILHSCSKCKWKLAHTRGLNQFLKRKLNFVPWYWHNEEQLKQLTKMIVY